MAKDEINEFIRQRHDDQLSEETKNRNDSVQHRGMDATEERVMKTSFGISREDIRNFVAKCTHCQVNLPRGSVLTCV